MSLKKKSCIDFSADFKETDKIFIAKVTKF